MTIEVASAKPESLKLAPAIVSSYQAQELLDLGLKDLKDFIDFVPGVRVNRSSAGVTPIAMRGLWDSHNQKVLFLVDGVPTWSSAHADVPLSGIPLAAIDRVEVMRGPSAIIYGSNASAGVINVVTKKSQRGTSFSLGEHGYRNIGANTTLNSARNMQLSLAFEYQSDEGYEAQVANAFSALDMNCFCFPSNSDGNLLIYEDKWSAHARYSWMGFETALLAYEATNSSSSDGSLLSPQKRIERGLVLSTNFERNYGQSTWKLFSDWDNSYVLHRASNANATLGLPGNGEYSFDNSGNNNVRWRTGGQLQYQTHHNYTLLSGLVYEHRSSEDRRFINYSGLDSLAPLGFEIQEDGSILLIEESSNNEKAAYLELSGEFAGVNLKAGLRHVINSAYGGKTLPRISAVKPLRHNQSIKFVYAVGFSSPTFAQTSATDQFGQPVDSDLTAELIESVDLAYTLTTQKNQFVLNAFWLQLDEGIVQQQARFTNAESLKRKGLELDYQYRQGPLKIYAGASYFFGLEKNISQGSTVDSLAEFTSQWQIDAGLSYRYNRNMIGVSLRSADGRRGTENYHWLNTSYSYTLSAWKLSIGIENILAEDVIFPDVRSGNDILIQGVDKQRVHAGVYYTF